MNKKKRYPNEKIGMEYIQANHRVAMKCQVLRMRVLLHQKFNKDILRQQKKKKIICSSSGKY